MRTARIDGTDVEACMLQFLNARERVVQELLNAGRGNLRRSQLLRDFSDNEMDFSR